MAKCVKNLYSLTTTVRTQEYLCRMIKARQFNGKNQGSAIGLAGAAILKKRKKEKREKREKEEKEEKH